MLLISHWNMMQEYTITFGKTVTAQGDDDTNGCLLDYRYWKRTVR